MTQAQFMYELMTAVHGLPDEAQYVIMQDYNEFFFNKKEEGLTEEQIIALLPSPKTIASDYRHGGMPAPIDGMKMAQRAEPPAQPTALSTFLFILLIPFCAVYEVLMAAVGAAGAIVLLALCISFALISVAGFSLWGLSAGFIVSGVGTLIVTIGCVLLSAGIFRAIFSGFLWFPKYMNRVRKNNTKRKSRR